MTVSCVEKCKSYGPITSFFERKSIQVSKNENPKPSDTIRNDNSDQACSTTKEVEAQRQVLNLSLTT